MDPLDAVLQAIDKAVVFWLILSVGIFWITRRVVAPGSVFAPGPRRAAVAFASLFLVVSVVGYVNNYQQLTAPPPLGFQGQAGTLLGPGVSTYKQLTEEQIREQERNRYYSNPTEVQKRQQIYNQRNYNPTEEQTRERLRNQR
jgi:hypothetical protein